MVPGPTFRSELKRGFNPYNLSVGAVSAVVLGGLVYWGTATTVIPDLSGAGAGRQGLCTAVGLFVLITLMHAGAHAYFGWRFERGLEAYAAGQWQRAATLLRPSAGRGIEHYDVDGVAKNAYQDASGRH